MNSLTKTSRIAGFWYLLVAIFGSVYSIFVESRLIMSGDAATTYDNILSSQGLFRLCILSNILTTICFITLAVYLYRLFTSVDKDLARLMVIFIIASVPIAPLQSLKFAPILLSSNTSHLSVFDQAQLHALTTLFLEIQKISLHITYVFYGLWMFPLGLLVFKSGKGYITKVLGVFLIIGCFGYVAKFLEVFFGLNIEAATSVWMNFTILAEVLFILWLFIQGPGDQNPAPIEATW